MRLIDADELKKCAIPCEIHNGALTELCVPLYQIDNAPTVDALPTPNWYKVYEDVKAIFDRPQDEITEEDIQNAIRAGYENGYSMAQAKYQRPQGEWLEKIIELFNKYDVLLVHQGGQIVPVKNTTKQDCYDLLYEIQELIEWRKILFNKI